MKYIGITGHRGSGKTSTAYLIGNILDCLKHGHSKEAIEMYYTDWIIYTLMSLVRCQNHL